MRRAAIGILLLSWLTAGRAHAYVRYQSKDGVPLYWKTSCVPVAIYLNGFTQLDADEVAKSVSAAAHTWSPDDVTCADGVSHPYLEIVPTLAVGGSASAKYDAHNVLVFQTGNWAHQGDALALTTVSAKDDGHIVDADIEINATAGLEWANIDDPSAPLGGHGVDLHDLQNALTHEFGHFIGLDHTCYIPDSVDPTMTKPIPLDDMGNPVPYCDVAPDAIRATVMFPSTTIAETSKRYLSPDDVRAVCEIYPAALDPKICPMDAPNDGLGCATVAAAGSHARPLVGLAALALGVVGFVWRRRRRA